jgi:hypothetical protein
MPLAVVGSSDYEIIAVLASGNQQTVYIYKFYDDESNNQRLQSSWSKWTFPVNATVLGIDIVDDNMGLVVQYHDIVSFEIIPIDSSFTDEELGCITHLDRRVTEDTTGVSAAVDGGVTTWTLPYQVRFIGLYPVFDTFTDEDSTELPAHEPDSAADIGSWDVLEVDTGSGPFDLTVTSNRLRWAAGTSDGRKAFCLRSENALIPTSGEWEQRVAIIRPTFTTGTYGVGVAFYLDPEGDFQESGGSTGDTYDAWPRGVYVILEQVDANNVRPRLLEFDGTDPGVVQDTTDSLDPFALASLATIELGVTVDGSDVTIWTEPSGGGTRTERGTATLMTDFASSGDLHAGVGGYNQSASNPVQTMDNFHMLIPFAGPADGTLVIVNRDTGAIIAALTRDSIGFNQVQATGDFTSTDVFIGLDSEGSIQFSRQHRREGPNVRTDGRLQLKYWEVDFEDTAAFDAVVDYLTVGGHSDKTYPFDYSATDPCGTSGIHRFPVLSRNDKATVTLRTTDHRPCTFQRAHWEAEYYRRIRRG